MKKDKLVDLVKEWKNDSLGCKHFRNKEVAEEIISKLKLNHSDEKDFIKIFGKPNKVISHANNKILRYNFNSICINNQIVEDSDYCVAEFTFKGKLSERNYICL